MLRALVLVMLCALPASRAVPLSELGKEPEIPFHVSAANRAWRDLQILESQVDELKEALEAAEDDLPATKAGNLEDGIESLEESMEELVESLEPYYPFEVNQDLLPQQLAYQARQQVWDCKLELRRLKARLTWEKVTASIERYRQRTAVAIQQTAPVRRDYVSLRGLRTRGARPAYAGIRFNFGRKRRSLEEGGEDDFEDEDDFEIDDFEEDD